MQQVVQYYLTLIVCLQGIVELTTGLNEEVLTCEAWAAVVYMYMYICSTMQRVVAVYQQQPWLHTPGLVYDIINTMTAAVTPIVVAVVLWTLGVVTFYCEPTSLPASVTGCPVPS